MSKNLTKYKYVYDISHLRRNRHDREGPVYMATVYIPGMVKSRYIRKSFNSKDYSSNEETLREAALFVDHKLIENNLPPINILTYKL